MKTTPTSAEALAAFLARGGQITKCPTASKSKCDATARKAWNETQAFERTGLTSAQRKALEAESTERSAEKSQEAATQARHLGASTSEALDAGRPASK